MFFRIDASSDAINTDYIIRVYKGKTNVTYLNEEGQPGIIIDTADDTLKYPFITEETRDKVYNELLTLIGCRTLLINGDK